MVEVLMEFSENVGDFVWEQASCSRAAPLSVPQRWGVGAYQNDLQRLALRLSSEISQWCRRIIEFQLGERFPLRDLAVPVGVEMGTPLNPQSFFIGSVGHENGLDHLIFGVGPSPGRSGIQPG
jgi:hypothetical protein